MNNDLNIGAGKDNEKLLDHENQIENDEPEGDEPTGLDNLPEGEHGHHKKKKKPHEHCENHEAKKEAKTQRKAQHNRDMWDRLEGISDEVNYLNVLLIVGILISTIVISIGIAILVRTGSLNAFYLLIFGLFTAGTFVYSIFAIRWYDNIVKEYVEDQFNRNPEALDQSKEVVFLNIFLFLIMLITLSCLFISIHYYLFQDNELNKIQQDGMDQKTWKEKHQNATYDDVVHRAKVLMYLAATFSLAFTVFMCGMLYLAFRMLGTYRSWNSVNQFVCIVFFFLGFSLIYLGIYGIKYKDVSKVEKTNPTWFPPVSIAVALISIAISVVGFIGSFLESKKVMKYFSIFASIITGILLLIFFATTIFAAEFDSMFSCSTVLDYIDQEYVVSNLGCKRKYVFVQENLDNMKCPKDRVISAWEVNLGKDVDQQKDYYGCVDSACCVRTFSLVKKKINMLVIICFGLLILSCLMTIGAFYMWEQLKDKLEFGAKGKTVKFLLITAAITVVVLLIIFILIIPNPPKPSPLSVTNVEEAPKNNTLVETAVIQVDVNKIKREKQNIAQNIQNSTTIIPNKTGCGDHCMSLEYYYELSSEDGIFTQNNTLLSKANVKIVTNTKNGNGWIVGFTGTEKNLQEFTQYFDFVNNCPLLPSYIKVKVIATAVQNNNTALLQQKTKISAMSLIQMRIKNEQTGSNSTISTTAEPTVVDVSKMKAGEKVTVLEKTLSHSFVTNNTQIVGGQVERVIDLNTLNPIQGATVKVTAQDFKNCPTHTYTTNSEGRFQTGVFYVLQGDSISKYIFDFNYPGYSPLSKVVSIGGLGWTDYIDLGIIKLWNPEMTSNYTLSTKIINSITNEPLQNVEVDLYLGHLDLINHQIEVSDNHKGNAASFLELAVNKQATINTTNNNDPANNSNPANNNNPQNNNNISNANNTNSNDAHKIIHILKVDTDTNGHFSCNNLPSGQYTIVMKKPGFYREVIYIDILGNFTRPLTHSKLTPIVDEGQIRFVLEWPNGPADLDIHADFQVSRFLKCAVYFGKKDCVGSVLDVDSYSGGENGGESITIQKLGNYVYAISVNKYIDYDLDFAQGEDPVPGATLSSTNKIQSSVPNTPFPFSKAKLSVYVSGFVGPIKEAYVPEEVNKYTTENESITDPNQLNWWLGFCLDGRIGINSLTPINKLFSEKPSFNYCQEYFKNNPA